MPKYLPQQVSPEPADTIAADSVVSLDVPPADSVGSIIGLGREVGNAGRLLFTGEWNLFWSGIYEGLADLVIEFVPKLLTAFLVFFLFYALYRILASVFKQILGRSKRIDPGLQSLILKIYRFVALTLISIMVLAQFDIDVTALLAGVSIVGIAVGFAARDTLENFISGITILMDRPFRIGDNIEVDGIYGNVEESTLRSTRIRTLNNEILVMPNILMITQKLINHSSLGAIRVEIPFGIAYKEIPQQARRVVLKLTEQDSRLHPDYKPDVVVTKLNDSSIDMVLRIWLQNPKLAVPVKLEYLEKVREALREADIEIPFPHLQLFIDEAKAFDNSPLMNRPSGLPGDTM